MQTIFLSRKAPSFLLKVFYSARIAKNYLTDKYITSFHEASIAYVKEQA